MKSCNLVIFVGLCATAAFGADCKPDDYASFEDLKSTVRRVITTGAITGWDDKAFNRAGDMAALAIVKVVPDEELAKPEFARNVLDVLRESFSCIGRCVQACSDREPAVALLLIYHLREISESSLHKDIEDTRKFVLRQTVEGRNQR
jgi:hypothetical protein